MSVFRGSVAEYPGVIIDHFVPYNCKRGRAFFLSHCHRDHMSGLGSDAIIQALKARQTSFHCSEVTCALLLKDPEFSSLAPYLKTLPMAEPVAMTMEALDDLSPLSFTVTLLPAGHCPGSVMFFFQGPGGNVLYTGDFRLTLEETKRLRPLHTSQGLMDIASMYLDTTFCHPMSATIPSRETSRDKVLQIIERWLTEDECNVVRLHCGTFGYEHILMSVAKKFQTKIHIARWKLEAYAEMPAVAECLTDDGDSTRIHCCMFRKGEPKPVKGQLPCGSRPTSGEKPARVLHIKPSTLWFLSVMKSLSEPCVFMPRFNKWRVIHSMHASYNEVCQFVSYLKPRRIVPCVVPVGDSSFAGLHVRLKTLLPQAEIDSSASTTGAGGDDGRDFKMKKRRKAGKEDLREPLEIADNDVSSLLAEDGPCGGILVDSQRPLMDEKEEDFFLSHVSKSDARFLLPSMLKTTGGVIAPPRPAKNAEVTGVGGSLEQTPLDLDSSEENSSRHSTPVKNDIAAGPATPSPPCTSFKMSDKVIEIDSQKDHPPLSKKARISCECARAAVVTLRSPRRRNLAKTICCHCNDRDCISRTDLTLSPQKTSNAPETLTLNNDHRTYIVNPINARPYNRNGRDRDSQEEDWEESDRSRSPSVLPLTPGKEEVESILHRKNLTLL